MNLSKMYRMDDRKQSDTCGYLIAAAIALVTLLPGQWQPALAHVSYTDCRYV